MVLLRIRNERAFTLIELLIVVAVIGIIVAIAVPGLQRGRISGNEVSAIGSMRSIHSGNLAYFAQRGGYAVAFNGPQGLADSANRFLPAEFNAAAPAKSGYTFTLAAGNPAGAAGPNVGMCQGAQSSFFSTGVPQAGKSSGQRSFAVREVGTIFVDTTGAAIADAAGGPTVGGNVTTLQ